MAEDAHQITGRTTGLSDALTEISASTWSDAEKNSVRLALDRLDVKISALIGELHHPRRAMTRARPPILPPEKETTEAERALREEVQKFRVGDASKTVSVTLTQNEILALLDALSYQQSRTAGRMPDAAGYSSWDKLARPRLWPRLPGSPKIQTGDSPISQPICGKRRLARKISANSASESPRERWTFDVTGFLA
jgi:hypothetical protein